jgi:AraC-like DNA-binding protein
MADFCFEYALNDLMEYAGGLACRFNREFNDNTLAYPEPVAAGGSRFYQVDDFISFQIAHYQTREKMIFKRYPHPSRKNHITISFQEFTFANPVHNDAGTNEIIFNNNGLGSVLCRSVNIHESMIIEPDTDVRVLLVLLKENWMDHVLKSDVHKQKFKKYFGDAEANFRKEYLGPHQMEILKELFSPADNRAISNIYYISRVMNLLEDFLTEVLQKDDMEGAFLFAKAEDIQKMQRVAGFIENNLHKPFSGVDSLSKWCYMSRTKFINLFQKVYGMSAYDYYQRKRLSIAYDSLKSGKHSIAAVAESIGYSSVTNFTVAFKKVFGKLPKDLLQKPVPEQYN